jgi:hypothetical protein
LKDDLAAYKKLNYFEWKVRWNLCLQILL